MKQQLAQLLAQAYSALQSQGMIPADHPVDILVERTRDRGHGDFASNLAMTLARVAGRKPRDIAEALVAALPQVAQVSKVEI
ncbi:MAG TPA: arginine--tRNA ligase, partial [Gammaproteobacteria bacterium]